MSASAQTSTYHPWLQADCITSQKAFGFWVLSIMARGMGISSPSPAPTETPEAHSCDGSV
jgi:hypothetical protein